MTVLGLFDVQISVPFQDAAPDYRYIKTVFDTALAQELLSMDPAKARTIRWLGPGPRVTRRVYEGARPGGTVRAVWPLVSDFDEALLGASQVQGLVRSVSTSITNQFRSGYNTTLRPDWTVDINVAISTYNEALNGPLSFWSGPSASTTHTRDRFPQTSVTGVPSEDQNENPIGPDSAALAPRPPGGGPADWTKFLIVAGSLAAGGTLIYLAWPYLSGARTVAAYRTRQRTAALRNPRQLGGRRRNPSGSKFETLQAKWRERQNALDEFGRALHVKYGHYETHWLKAGERTKLEKLRAAVDRASEPVYAWLEANSPWDWYSGVSMNYVRDKLTAAEALGEASPFIPDEYASYGNRGGHRPRR